MAGVDGGPKKKGGKTPGFDARAAEAYLIRDPETFAVNIARALENLGKAASEWLAPRERGEIPQTSADPVTGPAEAGGLGGDARPQSARSSALMAALLMPVLTLLLLGMNRLLGL